LGVESELQTPHPECLALGKTREERLSNYRELLKAQIAAETLKKIRESINKGLALGNEQFASQIEKLTNRRVTARAPARPKRQKMVYKCHSDLYFS